MIQVLAPAKLNLGLEILGKRPDGYHEIRTIFCAVSLLDHVSVRRAGSTIVDCDASLDAAENLAATAIRVAQNSFPQFGPVHVSIAKRIPAAAGLGGASSDAAASLLALNRLHGSPLSGNQLADLALQCGSDVPFFLDSGLALGEGRGENLRQLPVVSVHAVIVSPRIEIPDKTRTMYGKIDPSDWSNGERIAGLASRLKRHESIGAHELLPNAFRRPLYDLLPEVRELATRIEAMLGRPVQVSGAGPTLFVLCPQMADALRARRILESLRNQHVVSLHVVRSVSSVVMSEMSDE